MINQMFDLGFTFQKRVHVCGFVVVRFPKSEGERINALVEARCAASVSQAAEDILHKLENGHFPTSIQDIRCLCIICVSVFCLFVCVCVCVICVCVCVCAVICTLCVCLYMERVSYILKCPANHEDLT